MRKCVLEDTREACVPPFGHACSMAHGLFFLRVVVDVEMLGLDDAEVELVVADFVTSEVLSVGGSRRCEGRYERHEYQRAPNHGAPLTLGVG